MKLTLLSAVLASTAYAGVALAAAGKAGSPPPPPPAPPAFTYDLDFDIPASKAVGKRSTEPTEEALRIWSMPLPNAEGKKASYLVPVTVPAEITDADERVVEFKKLAKTVNNRVGGIIRRHRKSDDANKNKSFSVRIVMDEKLGFGVRIWRDADTVVPPAPAA